jgi:hypothetical protein
VPAAPGDSDPATTIHTLTLSDGTHVDVLA